MIHPCHMVFMRACSWAGPLSEQSAYLVGKVGLDGSR